MSGWSQAEAARKLDMTRGGMHGIVQGDTVPSIATVKLFRLVLLGEKPNVKLPPPSELSAGESALTVKEDGPNYGTESDWKLPLLRDLDDVVPEDREKVITALRAVVKLAPKRRIREKAA